MDLLNIADELRISHKNLQYYCGRYADDFRENNDTADTIARVALFRKLGVSHMTIHAAAAKDLSVPDILSASPKAKEYAYEALHEKQWADISYADCKRIIKSTDLQTPKQDVFWRGRLLDSGSAIAAAAGLAASLTFAHHGWKDIVFALIAGGTLAVIRTVAYTVVDILRWRRLGDSWVRR